MNNNDVLRRIRYTFDLNDDKMIATFGLGGKEVTRAEISDWLKRDEDPAFKLLNDRLLATFLNGFITLKRGPKDGPMPEPEKRLNNNLILRKIKIALNLIEEDLQEIFGLAEVKISKPELSAFFRQPGHKHFRHCNDQYLRRFLEGMQVKFHQV
ncbi:MAG: DUF1456 family protein [Bacteroidia bacterium]|nr:DUF1456 family protein [Bacteroidia bacterium]